MNKIRTIAATIFAILAVILAGTPTQAAPLSVGEADNIVYGSETRQEIWSVVIINAGSPTAARGIYRESDRDFILDNTADLFNSVGRGQQVEDETLEILGADDATFFEATSDLGPGAIIVAYAGDHVYMFMGVGIDDFEDFAAWNIEVIAAETFEGVDVPFGFKEIK